MANKPLSFEQLQELKQVNETDLQRKIYSFESDISDIDNIGICITYQDEIIYQREVKDGIVLRKEVRFYESKVEKKRTSY